MSSIATPTHSARYKTIGLWVFKVAFGLMFLGAGGAKLLGVQAMVSEFETVGLGQWFRYFAGATEVIGALLIVMPKTTAYGAVLLAVVCVGAFFAQLLAIHQDVIHTVIMGAILLAMALFSRHELRASSIAGDVSNAAR